MLTVSRLKEVLHYDQETGIFTRKISLNPRNTEGQAGGIFPNGYRRVAIDGKQYSEHRLAWLWVYGRWPLDEIDHINGIRDDNRICNLREATRSQNMANRSVAPGKSGLRGAYFEKATGKWFAAICVNRKTRRLGTFETPHEAHEVWKAESQKVFGNFSRVS